METENKQQGQKEEVEDYDEYEVPNSKDEYDEDTQSLDDNDDEITRTLGPVFKLIIRRKSKKSKGNKDYLQEEGKKQGTTLLELEANHSLELEAEICDSFYYGKDSHY
ncbi:hypothetical protein KY290_021312 [Solanum tuberosum]|uniref:Uncharacterized protein n=1 Tax=Solanum tuberosum TaxID=4113 RepID=A0ABQ7V177_SOLTU|nr:hypothetical protein KY290_021312 [Solanum tuberosum]